jgi:hypothetical protein
VREALRSRSSSACELRITVTADRQLGGAEGGGGGARLLGALGAERRYVLGTARVGLAELLRGGTDLVEQPLPLLGRNWDLADGAGAPPTLAVSLGAVAALAAVAVGLPGVASHGGALRPAAVLVAQRARLAARLQAASRGWLVRSGLGIGMGFRAWVRLRVRGGRLGRPVRWPRGEPLKPSPNLKSPHPSPSRSLKPSTQP